MLDFTKLSEELKKGKRKFELGEQQLQALNLIKDFIKNSDETAFSLCGSAGTGKTTLEKEIIDYLNTEWISYCLCAPTHKAALVMRQTTQEDAITLHKLLALSPNVEILDLDFRELQFKTSHVVNSIPNKGVVICDEASMINDDLFDLLILKCKDRKSKIIFLSDSKQLNPVKSRTCSKVYTLNNQFELTHIYRQSQESALTPILQSLRQRKLGKLDSQSAEDGSLFVVSDMRQFLDTAKTEFLEAINTRNILHTKVAAYTNTRVGLFNQAIRKFLWNDDVPYHKGEFLTSYENADYEGTMFYNSMDYIVNDEVEESTFELPHFYTPVKGYLLNLWDAYDKYTKECMILSRNNPDDVFEGLAATLEAIRFRAIEAKRTSSYRASLYWKQYFELMHSFTTPVPLVYDGRVVRKKSFDYGYASTSHKLQGSTYDKIFVDLRNINTCTDDKVKQQLQYVALSRTRTDAFVLQ
jgi:exodeoxyribonuclease-5